VSPGLLMTAKLDKDLDTGVTLILFYTKSISIGCMFDIIP